ncbi:hypothetical protein EYF80_052199 [Liparis tanakae]|uniref:Uncharacterized protein n=1 Tax=Liparis tanakae TaxID=230148 RepID=A0A4Z2FB76_9TELE|nr:hypothetical protein EYF80_052199 [Liparis tanakae]
MVDSVHLRRKTQNTKSAAAFRTEPKRKMGILSPTFKDSLLGSKVKVGSVAACSGSLVVTSAGVSPDIVSWLSPGVESASVSADREEEEEEEEEETRPTLARSFLSRRRPAARRPGPPASAAINEAFSRAHRRQPVWSRRASGCERQRPARPGMSNKLVYEIVPIEQRLQDARRRAEAGHGTSMLETLTALGSEPFLPLTAGFVGEATRRLRSTRRRNLQTLLPGAMVAAARDEMSAGSRASPKLLGTSNERRTVEEEQGKRSGER